jgi:murein DD-endopeptidase MepM/ murein hydrolase activator NlpD
MFSSPFKGCTAKNISQGFHSGHKALDIFKADKSKGRGEPLTAPEDVRILRLVGNSTSEGHRALEHGFGVFMLGLETGYTHLYWHVFPGFPLKEGDTIKRGQIVAFMSNSGTVFSGGKRVPIEGRNDTDAGTHLHWEVMDKGYVLGRTKPLIDFTNLIDWSLQPNYTFVDRQIATYKTVVSGLVRLLK